MLRRNICELARTNECGGMGIGGVDDHDKKRTSIPGGMIVINLRWLKAVSCTF